MPAQLDSVYMRSGPKRVLPRLLCYSLFEGRPLTTRGRWVNRVVFALFDRLKKMPPFRKVERPVFIIGMGRSGTTILGVIFSMHSRVAFLNEPKALWHAVHPYEDLVGSYSPGTAKYRLEGGDATPEAINAAHRLYGACLAVTFSQRVVDKYPELVFRIPFVKGIFPDARFVFLVRNGLDACRSITAWSKRFGTRQAGERHDWWGVDGRKWRLLVDQVAATDPQLREMLPEIYGFSRDEDKAAVEWIVTMREGVQQCAELGDQARMIRYEDLVAQPKKVFGELLEFCYLPRESSVLEYASEVLRPVRHNRTITLHPVLQPIFYQTMDSLEYRP